MRIVFFGTPEFAVPSLRALLGSAHTVAGVVTQPDKPQGRSRSSLVPPPVKLEAERAGVPVLQPDRPIGDLFLAALRRLEPDVGVVVAYGHILRPALLSLPRLGLLNVHASLLPRWRGAAPIQHAILAGDPETGVSIMRLEEGLDSGPVLHRVSTPIGARETAGELFDRLAELGAAALMDALACLAGNRANPEPQDPAAVTYASKFDRNDARIDWRGDGTTLARQVRAFDPSPGAWTTHAGAVLKLFRPEPVSGRGEPGCVLEAGQRLVVASGDGALALDEVQPAGRRRLPVAEWVRGRGIEAGVRLE